MWKELLYVAVGAGLGGVLRFLCTQGITYMMSSPSYWATLTVNTVGCFLIALLVTGGTHTLSLSTSARLFLIVGFCGGFTTFSSYINDFFTLYHSGKASLGIFYLLVSVLSGVIAFIAGSLLALELWKEKL